MLVDKSPFLTFTYDFVEFLISRLEEFVRYFRSEVKLINKVYFKERECNGKVVYELYIDTPSTDVELVFDENRIIEGYIQYMEIRNVELGEEQFLKLIELGREINRYVDENKEMFKIERIKALSKVLKLLGGKNVLGCDKQRQEGRLGSV